MGRSFIGMFFVFALGLSTLVGAAPLPAGSAADAGFSEARLARIDAHMNAAVAAGEMVGGMGLIARDGKVIYRSHWGVANRETGQPLNDETIFRWYSMSKPITSAALMMLHEEGRFALNDPVAKYLPELANLEVARSTADSALAIFSDGTQTRTVGTGMPAWRGSDAHRALGSPRSTTFCATPQGSAMDPLGARRWTRSIGRRGSRVSLGT